MFSFLPPSKHKGTVTKTLSIFLTPPKKMKLFASILAAVAVQSASAFVAGPQCQRTVVSSSTQQSMGLFDFFSEDARKEREARKQAEIEEQERFQREIIARRSNPKKMEEYEAKVRVRRALRSEY
jgi:hypothetical protein